MTAVREWRWAGWAVVGIVIVVFAPTLALRTVRYDDHWLWSESSPLHDLNAATLRDLFFELDARARHPLGTEYLPVRDLFVAFDMWIWGTWEHGPHITQLVLYAASVYLLGSLLEAFGFDQRVAWLGALLWAIHPLHVESVAWLSERKGILSGLFVLACGHAWIRYRRGGRTWWLVIAAACAVAGVWSKAPAMFAPLAYATWDLLVLPRSRRRWIAIVVVGGAAALAAVPVVLVARDARVIEETTAVNQPGRIASALGAQGHYVQRLVLAKPSSISHPIHTDGPSVVDIAVGLVALLGSALVTVKWLRDVSHHALRLALLAWAWIWFVPVSHLLVRVHILVADRFVYLWSLAACVGIAWLVIGLQRRVFRVAIAAALAGVLGIATIRAQSAWTSSVELFTHAFVINPRDPAVCENLAMSLRDDGRLEEAFVVLERGLSHHPKHPYLLKVKAAFLAARGQLDEAIQATALAAESGKASAMWMHADLLHQVRRDQEALPWAERATRRRPEIDGYAVTLTEILIALGKHADAVPILEDLVARASAQPRY
ncbi:MAG: hypothetical protein H0T65_20840, partial [Deltaproteobacteria bacterium]|nr:hypothetical protein [Deltaproteobacteria bacterium]